MTCCVLLRSALAANERTERPKGLRRRAVLIGAAASSVMTVGTFYWSGREDMLVLHCPFCGAKQADPYDAAKSPLAAPKGPSA